MPDAWIDEEDLPSWVHADDLQQQQDTRGGSPRGAGGGRTTPGGDGLVNQMDMLGLKGNISKLKGVQGELNQISPNLKSFSPQRYLYAVHADTSYEDLQQGIQRLRDSMDQQSSSLKVLVQNNFDRFVQAKNVIDSVYEDMKGKTLNETQDWGTHRLNTILRNSYGKAHEAINPLLERREKVEKLRSTMGLLEPYRLFFNLPNTLQESIQQGKYQQAARDYNKGKILLAQAIPNSTPATSDSASVNSQNTILETKKKVFMRIWSEVERIVAGLRAILEAELEEPWRGMEEHERNIRLLYDLDTPTDPVWHCLSSQYRWIKKIMAESYDEQILSLEELRKSEALAQTYDLSPSSRSGFFKQVLGNVKSSDFETMFVKEPDVWYWLMLTKGVKTISELLLRLLPDFWKMATSFMEGRLQKNQQGQRRVPADPQKANQCPAMVKDIIQLYAGQMSQLLLHMVEPEARKEAAQQQSQESQQEEEEKEPPRFDNSIVSSYFLGKLITEFSNCVNDISGLNISSSAFLVLAELMGRVREKFISVMCNNWGYDAKVFFHHEDWTLNPALPQTTQFISLFFDFQEQCLRSAHRFASIWTANSPGATASENESARVSATYTDAIRKGFLDGMFMFLDGLVHLAFTDGERTEDDKRNKTYEGAGSMASLASQGSGTSGPISKKVKRIDSNDLDARMLITISNMNELRSVIIPKLIGDIEKICNISIDDDRNMLNDVMSKLDTILFDDYIKRKAVVTQRTIETGIRFSGIDWSTIPRSSGVHAFVHEALLTLVMAHAQIGEIAPVLVHRALSALLASTLQDCLECFREVERFGIGGIMQATLDMEFMMHTLSQYNTPQSSETLQLIYKSIEESTEAKTSALEAEVARLKQLLDDERHNTHAQYLCFKDHQSREKGQERHINK
ncbi:hypothetical protein DFQ27_005532 [Actinomortierella ambigua]|uniref:Exocyst complex component SEC5 n=1 Tax=Actinomortierella ambigua TaxID=1343610 RepID=A0A9P6U1P4_9FUNG|nr:hypothetical protein DFQ27_005532 [Actinomortierella ambigua]